MIQIRQIACKKCGRLPGSEVVIINPGYRYLPYKHLECRRCGGVVDWVCDGTEDICEVSGGICQMHACFIDGDPRSKEARRRVEDARVADRRERNRSGLVDTVGEDDWPTKGGIFG